MLRISNAPMNIVGYNSWKKDSFEPTTYCDYDG